VRPLRSRRWFDDPSNSDLTALYLERYTNFGISVEELQSSRPIIGIAQTGRRPTAALDRNLAYLGLVEILFGYPIGSNCRDANIEDERVIYRCKAPLKHAAGFIVMRGNLFDSALMKTSVISAGFRERYLSNPNDPGSPSILNVSPEAAVGGGLALLRSGDRIRVDLRAARVDVLLSDAELDRRRQELVAKGGYAIPASQTPWQEMQRGTVGQLGTGAVLEPAVKYQHLAQTAGVPRHSH
jgi:dihydroxyacid dehydratase/phosphogluconate dehydratase